MSLVHPRIGVIADELIDADLVGDWLSNMSLSLMSQPRFVIGGQEIDPRDLAPSLTFDFNFDRAMLAAGAIERGIPDKQAYDSWGAALRRLAQR